MQPSEMSSSPMGAVVTARTSGFPRNNPQANDGCLAGAVKRVAAIGSDNANTEEDSQFKFTCIMDTVEQPLKLKLLKTSSVDGQVDGTESMGRRSSSELCAKVDTPGSVGSPVALGSRPRRKSTRASSSDEAAVHVTNQVPLPTSRRKLRRSIKVVETPVDSSESIKDQGRRSLERSKTRIDYKVCVRARHSRGSSPTIDEITHWRKPADLSRSLITPVGGEADSPHATSRRECLRLGGKMSPVRNGCSDSSMTTDEDLCVKNLVCGKPLQDKLVSTRHARRTTRKSTEILAASDAEQHVNKQTLRNKNNASMGDKGTNKTKRRHSSPTIDELTEKQSSKAHQSDSKDNMDKDDTNVRRPRETVQRRSTRKSWVNVEEPTINGTITCNVPSNVAESLDVGSRATSAFTVGNKENSSQQDSDHLLMKRSGSPVVRSGKKSRQKGSVSEKKDAESKARNRKKPCAISLSVGCKLEATDLCAVSPSTTITSPASFSFYTPRKRLKLERPPRAASFLEAGSEQATPMDCGPAPPEPTASTSLKPRITRPKQTRTKKSKCIKTPAASTASTKPDNPVEQCAPKSVLAAGADARMVSPPSVSDSPQSSSRDARSGRGRRATSSPACINAYSTEEASSRMSCSMDDADSTLDEDDKDEDGDLPVGFRSLPMSVPHEGDLVWAKVGRWPFWPAFIRKLYCKGKKRKGLKVSRVTVQFIADCTEFRDLVGLTYNQKKIIPFGGSHLVHEQLKREGQSQNSYHTDALRDAVSRAEAYLFKRASGCTSQSAGEYFAKDIPDDVLPNVETYVGGFDGDALMAGDHGNKDAETPSAGASDEESAMSPSSSAVSAVDSDSPEMSEKLKKRLNKRKQQCEQLLAIIKQETTKNHLVSVVTSHTPSERMELFRKKMRTKDEELRLRKHVCGPIDDETQQTELFEVVTQYYRDISPGQSYAGLKMIHDVLIPEAVIHALGKHRHCPRHKAVALFENGIKRTREEVKHITQSIPLDGEVSQEYRQRHAVKMEQLSRTLFQVPM